MIRCDCAYCIDLDEQGALCDHPCNLCGGEPIDAECDECTYYERRMSSPEMLDRIHVLEKRLGESEFWRKEYAESVISLKSENAKLRDLALNCYRMAKQLGTKCKRHCSHWPECCENDSLEHCEPCRLTALARELGIDMC